MDPFQTLTTTSSSSSPSLDDSSLHRSLQLEYATAKSNDHTKQDIVVDFGTGYDGKNGDTRRTISDTKPHSGSNIKELHRVTNRWKYMIFGLLSIAVIVAVYAIIHILSEDTFNLSTVLIIVLIGLMTVVAMSVVAYDRSMQRAHALIQRKAAKSTEFVSSMFPADMHRRLFDTSISGLNVPDSFLTRDIKMKKSPKPKVKDRRSTGTSVGTTSVTRNEDGTYKSKPIAELYPETTIMLADLVGFTAWSSARDPTQVFILLETIFIAFDEIAVERNVFKVETVGDCYVAVAGVPDARDDHAVAMAQFANDCLERFATLIQKLEVKLGPGTADLGMRIGLHSGPITGGILRGERSRFQLFGDTINTAARMESNSMKGRIQISEQTADLIFAAKLEHWLMKREDKIEAKGKGVLQTYWLVIKESNKVTPVPLPSSEDESNSTISDVGSHDIVRNGIRGLSTQHSKLVDYNTECLLGLLKQILARRAISHDFQEMTLPEAVMPSAVKSVMDDVAECIQLPAFHAGIERSKPMDVDTVYVDPNVVAQLRCLLQEICLYYNSSNYFHNFEHATHVAMSVLKLISRIVSPLESLSKQYGSERRLNASKLYDHTFGLTSDPLTLFACAFSALIQSVDHPGVPNTVLVHEQGDLAIKYKNQSIVEQNSIDVAWNLFMADTYTDLRAAIFATSSEQEHFRQIVIHSVMATDMTDPKLKEMRNQQWKQTFGGSNVPSRRRRTMNRDVDNRKATIVIEHLMQTSSIAHTMQHWHIYRKWSEKLYREMLVAYLIGRTEYDPSVDWYEREIQFFDFTVIPLARKLKECGVFGVSGHEYLNYAMNNRKAWESTGKEMVAEMSERCKSEITVEIMKLMKANPNPDSPQQQQQLQCAVSDQFGPDSLLLTSLWSNDNNYQSMLGSLDDPTSSDDDEHDDDNDAVVVVCDTLKPYSPVFPQRARTIPL